MAEWEDAPVAKPATGDGWEAAPAKARQPPDLPRWDIPGDIGRAAREGVSALKEDLTEAFSPERDKAARDQGIIPEAKHEAGKFGSAVKSIGDVGAILASPVTGTARALGGSALSYLPGITKRDADQGIDTAMMGLAPKSGLKAPMGPPSLPGVNPAAVPLIRDGYVFPPAAVTERPGVVASLLSGEGGKIKLFQEASVRNQVNTDRLAARGLGLNGNEVTVSDLQRIRADAGKAYSAIPAAMPQVNLSDAGFQSFVGRLGGRASSAAAAFPKLMKNAGIDELVDELSNGNVHKTEDVMQVIRQLRHDASMNFKTIDNPEKAALAFAQRQAADALDALIENSLTSQGKGDLASQYRKARETIAKTHDVEDAMRGGHVSASRLAILQNKGVPLSGDLKTIADSYNFSPRANQNPPKFGGVEDYSVLDILAGATAAAAGHPGLIAGIVARPIARRTVLTPRYQQRMITPSTLPPKPLTPMLMAPNVSDMVNGRNQ